MPSFKIESVLTEKTLLMSTILQSLEMSDPAPSEKQSAALCPAFLQTPLAKDYVLFLFVVFSDQVSQ